jgi:hypothetical protein
VLSIPNAWGQIGAIIFGGIAGGALLRVQTPADHASLPLKVSRRTGLGMLAIFLRAADWASSAGVGNAVADHQADRCVLSGGSLVFGGGHVVLPFLQASVVPPGWVTNDAFLAGYGAAQAVAAVVGLLLAALYNPVWTAGITSASDFALACADAPSRGGLRFRHFCSGLLALASLNLTCRNLVPTFPQRSPPLLLTTAACGGLRSAPDCRPRRTFLHLSYSYAAPFGPAILVTQDPTRT